jgi:hypothetical protein
MPSLSDAGKGERNELSQKEKKRISGRSKPALENLDTQRHTQHKKRQSEGKYGPNRSLFIAALA